MTTTATAGSRRGAAGRRPITVVAWVLQVALAFQFAGAGMIKLIGDPAMVDMFATIGIGQWFRYVVGALEVAGALGLLVPHLAGLAALGLFGVMVGATLTNVFILHVSPVVTLVLMVVAGVIVWVRRASLLAGPAPISRRQRL